MPEQRLINILLDFVPVSAFQREIILGASRYCQENPGFRCRSVSTESNLAEDGGVIDGVIAIVTEDYLRHAQRDCPVVNVSTINALVSYPTVSLDNWAIGQMAAEHLLEQGYRSFACHMESRVHFSQQRCLAFCETLKNRGQAVYAFDTGLHLSATPKQLHALTVNWLEQLPKPLGLFTHNDQRAVALMDVCYDACLKVPEEIGIIGVDNDELLANCCKPTLTSVDTGASAVGFRAMELLAQTLAGPVKQTRPVYLPPRAVKVRESTRPRNILDDRLVTAMRFIQDHCDQPVGVKELLDAVQISRRSLERLFQLHLGRSPAEEIRRVQINYIKWLLMEKRVSLSDVATAAGFSSFSNFATAFRRETGLSASAYRNRFNPDPN